MGQRQRAMRLDNHATVLTAHLLPSCHQPGVNLDFDISLIYWASCITNRSSRLALFNFFVFASGNTLQATWEHTAHYLANFLPELVFCLEIL